MKEILLRIARDLEDIRASLGPLVAASSGRKLSQADVQEAKNMAMQVHRTFYDELRNEIEKLP